MVIIMEKKISIVTPVFNAEKYIERNIRSIMNQNYTNYEHIIVDGGSTDNTLDVAGKYKDRYPMVLISEKDNGMYDAICKGFNIATGNIFAWLNADDTYYPWAFHVMNQTISDRVKWCTAIPTWQNDNDIVFSVDRGHIYNRAWIRKGLYDGRCFGFLQQESTYWSSSVWKSVNSEEIAKYKLSGDFRLWQLFAEVEELYTVNTIIGGFRIHHGQKSQDLQAYYAEAGCPDINRINKKIYHRLCIVYQRNHLDHLLRLDKNGNIS